MYCFFEKNHTLTAILPGLRETNSFKKQSPFLSRKYLTQSKSKESLKDINFHIISPIF